jgi:hypothetical protein
MRWRTEVIKFRVYPSQLIHYGRGAPSEAVFGLVIDNRFLSLCGHELIGYPLDREPEEWEPICQKCARSFEKMGNLYRAMADRLGVDDASAE